MQLCDLVAPLVFIIRIQVWRKQIYLATYYIFRIICFKVWRLQSKFYIRLKYYLKLAFYSTLNPTISICLYGQLGVFLETFLRLKNRFKTKRAIMTQSHSSNFVNLFLTFKSKVTLKKVFEINCLRYFDFLLKYSNNEIKKKLFNYNKLLSHERNWVFVTN